MTLRFLRPAIAVAAALLVGIFALSRAPAPAEAVGTLTLPFPTTNFWVTQGYWTLPTAYHEGHPAYDLVPMDTTTIIASAPGFATVHWDENCGPNTSSAQPSCDDNLCGAGESYGRWVDVDMGGDMHVLYPHLSAFTVPNGVSVARGQQLGVLGTAGCSTGPHIHFQVKHLNHSMDPGDPKTCDILTSMWTTCPASLVPPSGRGLNPNGDTRDDAVTFNQAGIAMVSESTVSGFTAPQNWGGVSAWGEIPGVGDFNGDGKHDSITFSPFGSGIVAESTGSSFGSTGYWGQVTTLGEIPSVGDFNADGKDDAITFNQSGQGVVSLSNGEEFGPSQIWGTVFTWGEVPAVGDFNGDGRDDVVTFNPLGEAWVSLSNGAGFIGPVLWGATWTWGEIPAVGDFNGDGRDDAITFNQSGHSFVSLSSGTRFLGPAPWGHVTTWGEIPAVGDFNGDGRDDAITFNRAAQGVVSLSEGTKFGSAWIWGDGITWGQVPGGFQTFAWHRLFIDADFDMACNEGILGPICGGQDNCPFVYNPLQTDFDHDSEGDTCDADADGDTVENLDDTCPMDPDPCGSISGDADCDGGINAIDALRVLRGAAGLGGSGDCVTTAGDVDCNGAVSALDALLLLRFVANLPQSLVLPPACPAIGT